MRKAAAVALAVTVMLSTAAVGAGPAGSATTGLTCTKLSGTATWSPPVPNNGTKVKSNTTLKPALAACKGTPKITGGALALPVVKATKADNCAGLIGKPSKINVPAGGSIVWTNQAKSALGAVTLSPAGVASYKASVKILAGQFSGKTLTATTQLVPVAGGCVVQGVAMSTATLQLKQGTRATIK